MPIIGQRESQHIFNFNNSFIKEKQFFFPQVLLAERELVWQLTDFFMSETAKYFSIACLLLKKEEGVTKTDFEMLFKAEKGIAYFQYHFVFLLRDVN